MRSFLPLLLILATPAFASDGVREINQTCAIQTGCFPGDTAGFPVLISQSGSYRLTSNLALPDQNTNGVQIEAPAVDLDLAGFAIEGPTVCTNIGDPPVTSCTPTGSGFGVLSSEGNLGIRVRDGVVRGAGFCGVGTPSNSVVENVRTFDNGSFGIFASFGARVGGCHATRNGTAGIRVLEGSKVIDCTTELNGGDGIEALGEGIELHRVNARRNSGSGIVAQTGAIVTGSIALRNGLAGIAVGPGSTVSGNTANQNGGDGISADDDSTLSGNVARTNGGNGINAGSGSTVRNNTSNFNSSDGIATSNSSTVTGNSAHANGVDGIDDGGASNISGNTARSNGEDGIDTSDASTVAGNTVFQNNRDGIRCGDGCTVKGNTVRTNSGDGMNLGFLSGYRENVISLNSNDQVSGGVDAGANVINGIVTPTPATTP